jgi:predicted 2-oxoglutarate/Fe(II)-dependent dioxygenase YbiX
MKTISIKNILSLSEIAALISYINDNIKDSGSSFTSQQESRGGNALPFPENLDISKSIKQSFIDLLEILNKTYKYELSDLSDIEFALVKYVEGCYIPPHIDLLTDDDDPYFDELNKRKLILITLLNDPSEFTGGDLSINLDCKHVVPLEIGHTVCFPSFFPHELSKVESGVRYVLSVVVKGKYPFR